MKSQRIIETLIELCKNSDNNFSKYIRQFFLKLVDSHYDSCRKFLNDLKMYFNENCLSKTTT